ncbi:MAG: sugar phosphate isomerase/epimerase [Clostridia bacterium]|nr:sugar phosphate isomerase/epimerase [Clostridia bacterium]
MKLGAQFYTLRDNCTTLDGLSESLKRVADIGYTTVQLSGVCPYEPEWVKEELDKNGLRCVLTHWNVDEVKNDPVSVLNKHRAFGCNNIGIGCMPGWPNEENTYKFIEEFKKPTQILAQNGSKLFYHNHHGEFIRCADGEMVFDKLINSFTKDELAFTLDTYWVQMGGGDVNEWLEKLKGRVECIHLKDLEMVGTEQRMAPIGQGSMNFEKIVASAIDAGTQYALVEQDNCYGRDPFECLKQSYEYLKSLGLN